MAGELVVSWDEYIELVERLVLMVEESGWEFDSLLCLARGGMRPGDLMSRILSRPLMVLSARSYREDAGKKRGELVISGVVTGGVPTGRVLLVDDLADSGVTLVRTIEFLRRGFPEITEIRTAVLWCKGCSVIRPDYCVSFLPESPWIRQPFEVYDDLGVEGLRALRAGRAGKAPCGE